MLAVDKKYVIPVSNENNTKDTLNKKKQKKNGYITILLHMLLLKKKSK